MERLAEILSLLTDEARAELTDEQVRELHDELTALFDAIRKGEVEEIARDDVATLADITEGVKALRTEAEARIEVAVAKEAEIDALAADVIVAEDPEPEPEGETLAEDSGDGDGDDDDDDDKAKVVAEAEEIVEEAAAEQPDRGDAVRAAAERIRQMARTNPRQPTREEVHGAVLRRLSTGEPTDIDGIVDAMLSTRRTFGDTPPGFTQKVAVGRAEIEDGGDTDLRRFDRETAGQKIAEHLRELNATAGSSWSAAVVASGGWCAPKENIYDLLNISVTQRPIEDSLPTFVTQRGGISWTPPPKLNTINTSTDGTAGNAVTRLTAAQDLAGSPTKPHQRIDCPSQTTAELDIITKILEFGNLIERSWPELVRHFNELVLAAHARMAENLLLTRLGASPTVAVTGPASTLGAVPTMLSQINRLIRSTRNVNRMSPDARFRVYMPQWVTGLFQDDLSFRGSSQAFNELFGADEAQIRSWFDQRGANVTFHLDGDSTGLGATEQQIMPAQGAAPVVSWPDKVVSYVFPEGSWVHLTGGELDLGVVRDSTLNETNDFQVFSETFESAAFFGWAGTSFKVTHTLEADGAAAGTVTPANVGS